MSDKNTNQVADIFRVYGDSYRKQNKLPLQTHKVINAITACRTEALGHHVEQCNSCGYKELVYNSCRNRHCPKCQGQARKKWCEEREKELLPVDYYHVVFTLPKELEPIALRNKRLIYGMLFEAVSKTLLEIASDKKHHLKAQIGFTAILHTWTQTLLHHPHVHCVVPGGGLSLDNKEWINSPNGFFLPVKVLSRFFRGKFLSYLKEANENNKIKFCGEIEYLQEKNEFKSLLRKLYQKEWVVYCKPPFGSTEQVLKYISSYVHRIAISNARITNIESGNVTFRYRDSKDGNKLKEMTISAHEFIRRFLLHILPNSFMKIRYYGILSNRNKRTTLVICRLLLLIMGKKTSKKNSEENYYSVCPQCQKGLMKIVSNTPTNGNYSKKIS